jgi:proteasome activator subunit 4
MIFAGKFVFTFQHSILLGGLSWATLSYLDSLCATWSGLPTFLQEGPKDVPNPCLNEDTELESLVLTPLILNAGFCLKDRTDPRYQRAAAHRARFGHVIHRAAQTLLQDSQGEDHIDAVMYVLKAVDRYLHSYAMRKSDYDNAEKVYASLRQSVFYLRIRFDFVADINHHYHHHHRNH